jgi:hypothetical protein
MRRRGELSAARMDRDWPHQVILPASSCSGPNEAIIHDFCQDLSVCSRTHSLVMGDQWHLVYCFQDPDHADRFRERFGGVKFDPALRGRGGGWHLLRNPRQKYY